MTEKDTRMIGKDIIGKRKNLYRIPFSLLPEPVRAQIAVRPDAPRVDGVVEDWNTVRWGKEDEKFFMKRIGIVKIDKDEGAILVEDTVEISSPLGVVIIPTRVKPRRLLWGEIQFLLIKEDIPNFTPIAIFPQGLIRENESIETAVSREFKEETGYQEENSDLNEYLGSKPQDAKYAPQSPEFYTLVKVPYNTKNHERNGDEDESIKIEGWKTLRELEKGKLKMSDKRTIVAIDYLLKHYKIRGVIAIILSHF